MGVASVLEERDRLAATYRGHGHALALGVDPQGAARRDARPRDGRQRRPRRLDEHQLAEEPAGRLVRDRRRNDRRRNGRRPRAQARRRRRRLPVRRWRDQPGLLLRVPQLLRGAAAAGRLPVREQRLRRVHAVPGRHRRRDPRPRRGDGGARRDRRRDERRRRAGCRRPGGRARARRWRPRTSSRRSRTATSGTPAATPAPTGRPASSTLWKERDPIPRLRGELVDAGVDPAVVDAIDDEVAALLGEMERRGLEAPFPEPRPARGVQAGEPERPAHAAPLGLDERGNDRRMAEAARASRSSAAIRWSRSRPTRRPSSTRPRRTACSPRSSCPKAESRRSASRSRGWAGMTARTRVDGAGPHRRSWPLWRAPRAPSLPQTAATTRARATPVARRTAADRSASRCSGSTARARAAGSASSTSCERAGDSAAGADAAPVPRPDLKGPTTVVELSTTGQTIARRMTQSRSEIPSFDVVVQADMSTSCSSAAAPASSSRPSRRSTTSSSRPWRSRCGSSPPSTARSSTGGASATAG